jgi:hypothetical protein
MSDPLQDLPISYEQLRSLVAEQILKTRQGFGEAGRGLVTDLYTAVARSAVLEKRLVADPNGSNPGRHASYHLSRNDQTRVQDIFWDLLIEGVVRPGLGDGTNNDLPHFHVTDRGKAALSEASPSPYDPDGYLRRLRADIPAIDPVIVTYLEESLHTFRINCLLSSTVTLGCASEKALLLLLEAYARALEPTRATRFRKDTDGKMIKQQFDVFQKRLDDHLRGKLDRELLADLETRLLGVFSMIREVRNEAGHPSGRVPEREVCYANLTVFPSYLRKVYDLIGWLDGQAAGSLA